ncbi:MAG: hypothetical protein AABW73_04265 [Nanoarchaeota archaeon]
MLIKGVNKRGQVTIFVIIALVILGAIGIYLATNYSTTNQGIPEQFQELEEYYNSCIKEIASGGISIIENNGGFIEEPELIRGNPQEPLSSKINYLGETIPYWLYLNDGKIVEQAPTKNSMQEQISKYIKNRINECNFEDYSSQGYIIERGENPVVEVTINNKEVTTKVTDQLVYAKEETKQLVSNHEIRIDSNLGALYNKAIELYNKELQNEYLENYTVDMIRLYAPVDGVEISCSPKVWKEKEVFDELREAIEANTQQIMLDSGKNDDSMTTKEKYFTIPISSDGLQTYMRYSKDWPTSMKIHQSDGGILIANPVGNQEGLGILGFCYVPYHFVYDLDYPLMIQIFDENSEEMFQYPIQVIIRSNHARQGINQVYQGLENTICKYKVKSIEVNTYDEETLMPVEAQISFKCLNEGCYLGETRTDTNNNAKATLNAPQCVNGFLTATAEGYNKGEYQISTNNETIANILLKKQYTLNINVKYDDGQEVKSNAFIYLKPARGNGEVKTVVWPEQKTITITEGEYNITAYAYELSNITLPGTKEKKCFQVPRPGLSAVLGLTKEQCYDITIPGQKISTSISGGGKTNYYFTQSQIRTQKNVQVTIPRGPTPRTIEALQTAYAIADNKQITITTQ